ncbi:MAG TPA: acylphosphatase, partial [Opitutaceae bacterium]|nr:acylphosphatase [Opitutaceae bacterium]
PFVVRVARKLGLRGWVRHDTGGALVRAVGLEDQLVLLVRAIRDDAPASLRVRGMEPEAVTPHTAPVGDRFVALVDDGSDVHGSAPLPHAV